MREQQTGDQDGTCLRRQPHLSAAPRFTHSAVKLCFLLVGMCSQAEPKMRELTEGQLQPAAQKIADQAMPLAKGVTDGAIRPAAQQVADQVRSFSF